MNDPRNGEPDPIERVDEAIDRASVGGGTEDGDMAEEADPADLEPGGTRSEDDLGNFA